MNQSDFGQRYRRFLWGMAILARLPIGMAYSFATLLARRFSPLLGNEATFRQSLLDSGIPFDWMPVWRQRLADHAVFCVNSLRGAAFSQKWLQRHVEVDKALLARAAAEGKGVLFLTYHHPFHHTLFCVLGLLGLRVQVLASTEESSPIYGQIGQYIRAMHRNCARHFNGGDYLFFSQGQAGARMAGKALRNRDLLVSLNDYNHLGEEKTTIRQEILGRHTFIPVGSIRLACRMGAPVIAGVMLREGTHYRVELRRLDAATPEAIAADYMAFLNEMLARHPAIWDGWDWFPTLSVP